MALGGALGAPAALEAPGVAERVSFQKLAPLSHETQKLDLNVDFTKCS